MSEDMPTNGGTQRDYLVRIEASVRALQDSMQSLVGNPPADPSGGRIGRLEAKVDNFISATQRREDSYESRNQQKTQLRWTKYGTYALYIGVLASIVMSALAWTVPHP